MYADGNPRTKKQLKEWIAQGRAVHVFQPGGIFTEKLADNQEVTVEGPHYPEPHRFYARVRVDHTGQILKVIG